MENDDLKNYIEKILKIERDQSLTEDDYRSIAKEIGLTDDDLVYIDTRVNQHLKRGENFTEIKEYKKAVSQYKQAAELKPHKLEIIYSLAKAYFNLYESKGRKKDQVAGITQCNRIIKKNPDSSDAFELLEKLKSIPSKLTKWIRNIALFVVISSASIGFIVFVMQMEVKDIDWSNDLINFKAEFIKDENSESMSAVFQETLFSDFEDAIAYSLSGYFKLHDVEIHPPFSFRVTLLDSAGKILYEEIENELEDYDPVVHKDEVLFFDYCMYADGVFRNVKKAAVSLNKVTVKKPQEDYKLKEIDVIYKSILLEKMNIQIYERINLVEGNYNTLVFQIENSGEKPVHNLQLIVDWFDESGNLLYSKSMDCLSKGESSLEPEYKMPVKVFGVITDGEKFHHYTVSVALIN